MSLCLLLIKCISKFEELIKYPASFTQDYLASTEPES